MSDLIIHPSTMQQIEAFASNPSHAVLIVGPTGSGKLEIATRLAEQILQIQEGSFIDHPYTTLVTSSEGKAIGIDAVRNLEHFLTLKVPNDQASNRVVIVDRAQLMSTEAQNAVLKTLEEPPRGTVLILTTSSLQSLLPTIRSRAQSIHVKNIDIDRAIDAYSEHGFDPETIRQNHLISGGLASLMSALMHNQDHELLVATQKARSLLSQSYYERLLMVDELSKNTALAKDLIYIMQQMAHVSLVKADKESSKKWSKILKANYEADEALNRNAQTKLVLTKLMLAL